MMAVLGSSLEEAVFTQSLSWGVFVTNPALCKETEMNEHFFIVLLILTWQNRVAEEAVSGRLPSPIQPELEMRI